MQLKDYYGNVALCIVGDKCYDIDGKWVYEKRGDYICDSLGNWLYEIRGDRVYNTNGDWVFRIHDEKLQGSIPLGHSNVSRNGAAAKFCTNCLRKLSQHHENFCRYCGVRLSGS